MLQAAAVLPQVDPFSQAVERIGEQQPSTFIQCRGARLKVFKLRLHARPTTRRGVTGGAFQPVSRLLQQRLQLFCLCRCASLQGRQGVVEGVDHRQQMNHPSAQFTGIFDRLRPRAFVRQLADHQLQRVEGGHH
ncbi:hypothetical protein D3C77_333910 [compost metagenome]